MRFTSAVLASLVVAATMPTGAEAQDRRGRDRGIVEVDAPGLRNGFFIAGGFGAGSEQYKYSDELNFTEKLTKPTFTLRMGGTPDQHVRLGAELFGWSANEGDYRESFGTVLGVVQFYPIREAGLWVKGGAGLAVSRQDNVDPIFIDVTETGFGWSLGVGYEAMLSNSLGIGPSVELYQGSFTRRNEPTLTEKVLNIGFQITFQSGGH